MHNNLYYRPQALRNTHQHWNSIYKSVGALFLCTYILAISQDLLPQKGWTNRTGFAIWSAQYAEQGCLQKLNAGAVQLAAMVYSNAGALVFVFVVLDEAKTSKQSTVVETSKSLETNHTRKEILPLP